MYLKETWGSDMCTLISDTEALELHGKDVCVEVKNLKHLLELVKGYPILELSERLQKELNEEKI
jgi:hypothetical protein